MVGVEVFLRRVYAQLVDGGDHCSTENNAEIACTFRNLIDWLTRQVDRNPTSLAGEVDSVINKAYERMSSPTCTASFLWRKLYTDACISKTLVLLLTSQDLHESIARIGIATLDRAIIMAGAPGDTSLELVLDMIKWIQSNAVWQDNTLAPGNFEFRSTGNVVRPPLSATGSVSCITPPSLVAFQNTWCHSPFVLKGYIADWPAVKQWVFVDYLYSIAGPGRIVPVEIGNDYRTDDWTQKLLGWEEFLSALCTQDRNVGQALYLAQHNLLKQFPALMEDIIVPDYAFMSTGSSTSYPAYKPPSNEDQLVINVWFGPKGTISPAHTDPFFNCYAQVAGRKTVWLAPLEVESFMYPYKSTGTNDDTHRPATNNLEPHMSNTSRVDVFSTSMGAQHACREKHPAFWDSVPEKALSVTLEPGDLLVFPPGWWHAMRSEDVSFSVSMWF